MNNRASCDKAFDSHLAVGFIVRCDVFKKSWGDSLDHFCFTNQLKIYFFFGKVSIQVFVPFLNWGICFPGVEFDKFFVDFG